MMNLNQSQINAVKSDGSNRTYEVTLEDGTKKYYPSVTTIINFVVNKPALPPWAYNVGVKATLDYINDLDPQAIVDHGLPNEGEVKLALQEREATHKDEMEAGAKRGIEVHSVLEAYAKGKPWSEITYSRQYKEYVDTLRKWIDDYEPEFHEAEYKVASLDYGYAGQFDGICTIHKHPPRRKHESLVGKRVLLDVKTNSSGAVYAESHIPQVEGYAAAWYEMGGTHIDARLVVGIGPDGKYTPCVSYGRFKTFECILDLYKELQWLKANNPNSRSK